MEYKQIDKTYFITFSEKEKDKIAISIEDDSDTYSQDISLKELKAKSIVFKMYDTQQENIDFLHNRLRKRALKLYKEDPNTLLFNLRLYNYEGESHSLCIQLPKQKNSDSSMNIFKDCSPDLITNNLEKKFLLNALKTVLKKDIKQIKNLYQASKDTDSASIFHKKCDKKSKTLVLIKTNDDRRFGGYTSETWEGDSINKDDSTAFTFSLDKKKFYKIKPENKAITCDKNFGPSFGYGDDITICDKCFSIKNSFTNEQYSGCSFDYNNDNSALSNFGNGIGMYVRDYQVLQVII